MANDRGGDVPPDVRDGDEPVDREELLERLRMAELRFRLLADNSTDLIYRTDAQGVIRWVSDSAGPLLGYSVDEMLGKTIMDFSHPEQAAQYRELRRQLYAGEITVADVPNPGLSRLRSKDGRCVWFSAYSKAVPDDLDDGHGRGGLILSLRSVDDLVQAREAAEEAQARAERAREEAEAARDEATSTRLSMDVAAIGMALASPEGHFLHANPALCTMLGYEPGELTGRHFADITHPADQHSGIAFADQLLRGDRDAFEQRKRYLTKAGGIVWVDLSVAAVREPNGSLRHFVAQMVDVSVEVANFEAMQRTVRQFRILAENANDVVYQTSPDGVIEWVSPSMGSVLGWEPELLIGTHAHSLIAPEDLPAAMGRSEAVRVGDRVGSVLLRYLSTDGTRRWMSVTTKHISGAAGDTVGAVYGLRDVTAEQRARQRLARSEERFRLAMAGAPQGMALTDAGGHVLDLNTVMCRLLGATRDEMLQTRLADRIGLHEHDRLPELGAPLRYEHPVHTPGGERWVDHSVSAVAGDDEGVLFYVHQFVDQTTARELQRELSYRASRDLLTGVHNRHTLMEHLSRVLSVAGHSVALLFCDVDGLKAINDTYGHLIGDAVLAGIGERLNRTVRSGDAVGRVGGDEFVVVLGDVDDAEELRTIGEKLCAVAAAERRHGDVELEVSMSIGGALATADDLPETLLARADRALYGAKHAGRNRVVVDAPDRPQPTPADAELHPGPDEDLDLRESQGVPHVT